MVNENIIVCNDGWRQPEQFPIRRIKHPAEDSSMLVRLQQRLGFVFGFFFLVGCSGLVCICSWSDSGGFFCDSLLPFVAFCRLRSFSAHSNRNSAYTVPGHSSWRSA